MAFKVRKLDHRPWPVTVKQRECQPDGSVTEFAQTFIAHWKPFTEDYLAARRVEIFGSGSDEELASKAAARDVREEARLQGRFYAGLLAGWSEMQDEAGNPLPFSEDQVIDLCTGPDGPDFRLAFGNALLEIRFGIAPTWQGGAEKNASTSPAPGPAAGASGAPTS